MKLKCVIGDKEMFIKNHTYKVLHWIKSSVGTLYKIKSEVGEEYFVPLNGEAYKFEIVKENEMKELTLQQAFECEVGAKFKVIYEDGSSPENKIELCKDENEIISFIWDDEDDAILTKSIMTAKFIPIVEKEVSFMEAIKAFSEGKKIKSDWDGDEFIYDGKNQGELVDSEGAVMRVHEIFKAKWYIID